MPRKNRPRVDDPTDLQRKVRRHNTYFGWCARMKTHLEDILHAETVTDQTRHAADRALADIRILVATLKVRRPE